MKLKAFFIIFKGLSVVTNCFIHESGSLIIGDPKNVQKVALLTPELQR